MKWSEKVQNAMLLPCWLGEATMRCRTTAFFKSQGYLIVPGAMDTALCRQVRELMWQRCPPRYAPAGDDPASFVGPFSEQDESSDERHMRADYRWLNRFLG